MDLREYYGRLKARLLEDGSICPENRALFSEFFAFQEYKLKRSNGLPELDDGCLKTLLGYTQRLRNVNLWFGNTPWRDFTKADIKRVYDGLEDGTIRTRRGTMFQDRSSYYNKVFKSKPFRLAGKDGLAREVIEFSTKIKPVVRFVTEEVFRKLAAAVTYPPYRFLIWLAWDIGENIDSLLKLRRRDFSIQTNRHSGEREYVVHLAPQNLKRTRQSRSEVTLYPESVAHGDEVLEQLEPDALVFPFQYRTAFKFIQTAARHSGATTMPLGQPVRWKDLRSGMACHLLRHGWTTDEVNARLGHAPHSPVLDAYINFLAIDREAPKRRMLQAAELGRGESLSVPVPIHAQEGTPLPRVSASSPTDAPQGGAMAPMHDHLNQLISSLDSLKTALSMPLSRPLR